MGNRHTMIKRCLAILLLIVCGCTPVASRSVGVMNVAPQADKSICIQRDESKPDTALIVEPLETELISKGYKVVKEPDHAAYIMRLDLIAFGLNGHAPQKTSSSSAPMVGSATGTAVGSAVSGSVLHTTSAAGTAGGLIGFGVGTVYGIFSGPRSVPFIGKIEVSITDSSKKEQKLLLSAWARVHKEKQIIKARDAVSTKLASKVAALMP